MARTNKKQNSQTEGQPGIIPSKDSSTVTIPPEEKAKQVARIVAVTEEYGGPLPHPSILKGYEEVLPGAAERIIHMAESQSEHRQYLEKTVIKGDSLRSYLGLGAGLIIALCWLGGSVFLIYKGHDFAGASLGAIDIFALVSVFVTGTLTRRRERIDKAAIMGAATNKKRT